MRYGGPLLNEGCFALNPGFQFLMTIGYLTKENVLELPTVTRTERNTIGIYQ